MSKSFLVLWAMLAGATLLWAADQESDTIVLNGKKYAVAVTRDCPSVVQVFFQRTASPSPFQAWSTNNSRGHIAWLEVIDNKLILSRIEARRYRTHSGNLWSESGIDTTVTPDYFQIASLDDSSTAYGPAVCADWFSGVLKLYPLQAAKRGKREHPVRLLHVVQGKVYEDITTTEEECETVRQKASPAPAQKELGAVLRLADRYAGFYVRSALDAEAVVMNGHQGRFAKQALTLVMARHANDPLQWWASVPDRYHEGAPIGSWLLRNDSLFLTAVDIHSGRELYRYLSYPLPLAEYVRDDMLQEGMIFASWLEGNYEIQYGNADTNAFGIPEYTVYKTQQIRVSGGVVRSSKFSPRGFDDEERQEAASFQVCHGDQLFSVDDRQLAEAVGEYRHPKKNPVYEGGKNAIRNYFLTHPVPDERVKDRLFRVRVAFLVNCNGEVGQWQIISKGKGELYELANIVFEVVRTLPDKWQPAEDRKGNKVDCWQILEFTVSNGVLTNANYK